MCLITKQSKPSIATEDIVGYKVLTIKETDPTNISYYSYIYDFEWELGKLYETKLGEIEEGDIYEGFHSCSTIDGAKIYQANNVEHIFKCIIPKGAEYYKGRSRIFGRSIEGYVSNKIIIERNVLQL